MTIYSLNDDLSFCCIDGRPIFLDTADDRFFRLSGALERAFNAHMQGADLSLEEIAQLVERNILKDSPSFATITRASVPIASRSALELCTPSTPHGIGAVAELSAIVCWTQFQLKTRRLKAILGDASTRRRWQSEPGIVGPERRLLSEVHIFLKARKFVPIEARCLLDSLSMVTFLARRHLYANIVFGVTSYPFTAHCWAQAGELLLNDAIGNTRAYTPIRVI